MAGAGPGQRDGQRLLRGHGDPGREPRPEQRDDERADEPAMLPMFVLSGAFFSSAHFPAAMSVVNALP
jgi:hypothetical protein